MTFPGRSVREGWCARPCAVTFPGGGWPGHTGSVAEFRVTVDEETASWLRALAVVRGVEVDDLFRLGMRRLRVSETERDRVAFYRYVEATGTG